MALVLSGALVLPASVPALRTVLPNSGPEALVAYRLDQLSPIAYQSAIETALTADDADLAASLVSLADERAIALTPESRSRVIDAQGFHLDRSLRQTWRGLAGHETASPEALAGAVTADLTGVTDMRDLLHEGGAYLADKPYDPLTLGLAAVGLVATGATILSLGAAAPLRGGLTVVKVAAKTGTLKPSMRRALVTAASDLVDRPVFGDALTLLRRGELRAARTTLSRSLRTAPLQTLHTVSRDLGGVATLRGYRAAHDVLKLAETPRDVSRLSAIATRLGKGFRGAAALLGAGMLTIGGIIATITGWLVAAGLWILSALYFLYRLARWIGRRVTPKIRASR